MVRGGLLKQTEGVGSAGAGSLASHGSAGHVGGGHRLHHTGSPFMPGCGVVSRKGEGTERQVGPSQGLQPTRAVTALRRPSWVDRRGGGKPECQHWTQDPRMPGPSWGQELQVLAQNKGPGVGQTPPALLPEAQPFLPSPGLHGPARVHGSPGLPPAPGCTPGFRHSAQEAMSKREMWKSPAPRSGPQELLGAPAQQLWSSCHRVKGLECTGSPRPQSFIISISHSSTESYYEV